MLRSELLGHRPARDEKGDETRRAVLRRSKLLEQGDERYERDTNERKKRFVCINLIRFLEYGARSRLKRSERYNN